VREMSNSVASERWRESHKKEKKEKEEEEEERVCSW
jgi:hypothetical protein